jgi:hypothetical protein
MKSSTADERVFCPDCHRATEVVLDHATGDTICTECALVLDTHFIDEGSTGDPLICGMGPSALEQTMMAPSIYAAAT